MSLISGARHPSAGKDSALATFRFTASLHIQPKQSEFHGNKHKVGSVFGKLVNVIKVLFLVGQQSLITYLLTLYHYDHDYVLYIDL